MTWYMAGKHDVMICALSFVWRHSNFLLLHHSNISAMSYSLPLCKCEIAAEGCFNALYSFSGYEKSPKIKIG